MKARKTIFDLERRINLSEEYNELYKDIAKNAGFVYDSIKTWPYRQATIDVETYANKHGFSFDHAETDEDILYSLELMLNLLHWAPKYKKQVNAFSGLEIMDGLNVSDECNRCIENIAYILEGLNMQVREIEAEPISQYTISKRDVDIDAVLETVPELSDVLLSYLDIRNQKDEAAKKSILKRIADYLEPLRYTKYKGTSYSQLCDDLFAVFNSAGLRHNNKKQWALKKAERMNLYDQTFKAAVHLLQSNEASKFKETVAQLKQRATENEPSTSSN